MLIVHHTRKEKGEDIFDSISGTNGLLGAADGAFLLSKNKRTANEAIMDVNLRIKFTPSVALERVVLGAFLFFTAYLVDF